MSSSNHAGPASARVTFAEDELWRFQLRREHNGLVEELSTQKKESDARQKELNALAQVVAENKRQLKAQMETNLEDKKKLKDLEERLVGQAATIQELQQQCLSGKDFGIIQELTKAFSTNKNKALGLVIAEEEANQHVAGRCTVDAPDGL
jgi:hypothetical protein